MHQFSIHTPAGTHLGFLIMLPDDVHEPTHGQLALKLLDNLPNMLHTAAQPLIEWANAGALTWIVGNQNVSVHDEDGELMGSIRQEWLIIKGAQFVLNDLEGAL